MEHPTSPSRLLTKPVSTKSPPFPYSDSGNANDQGDDDTTASTPSPPPSYDMAVSQDAARSSLSDVQVRERQGSNAFDCVPGYYCHCDSRNSHQHCDSNRHNNNNNNHQRTRHYSNNNSNNNWKNNNTRSPNQQPQPQSQQPPKNQQTRIRGPLGCALGYEPVYGPIGAVFWIAGTPVRLGMLSVSAVQNVRAEKKKKEKREEEKQVRMDGNYDDQEITVERPEIMLASVGVGDGKY